LAFTHDRVVDTPRRARPSRAEADHGRVDGAREVGDLPALGLGGPDPGLGIEEDDVADAEALARETGELVGVLLEGAPGVVDPEAEPPAAQRRQAAGQRPGLARTERHRGEDRDRLHGSVSAASPEWGSSVAAWGAPGGAEVSPPGARVAYGLSPGTLPRA